MGRRQERQRANRAADLTDPIAVSVTGHAVIAYAAWCPVGGWRIDPQRAMEPMESADGRTTAAGMRQAAALARAIGGDHEAAFQLLAAAWRHRYTRGR